MRCKVRIDRSTSSRFGYVEMEREVDLTREGGREGGVLVGWLIGLVCGFCGFGFG